MADIVTVNQHQPEGKISIEIPPMPKPEDFGIQWENVGSIGLHSQATEARIRFREQKQLYQEALAAWKTVAIELTQSIRDLK